MMTIDIDKAVEQYMKLPYRMEVYFDDDYWAVEFPELPGLVAGHETWEGLGEAVEDAKRTFFSAALELGAAIPRPSPQQEEYSGRIMLRLQKSLHRLAARRAHHEGVSLNTLIAGAVAKEIGWGVPVPSYAEHRLEDHEGSRNLHTGELRSDANVIRWPLRPKGTAFRWRDGVEGRA